MSRMPFMKIFWADFFSDPLVRWLTPEQKGVYLLLLGHMWENGGWISADDRVIARTIGMDVRRWRGQYAEAIYPMMSTIPDDFLGTVMVQKRLRQEYEKAVDLREKRIANLPPSSPKKRAAATKRTPSPAKEKPAQPASPISEPEQAADQVAHRRAIDIAREKSSALQAESSSQAQPSQDGGSHPRDAARSPEPARSADADAELGAVRSELTKRLVEDGLKPKPRSLSDIANMGGKP